MEVRLVPADHRDFLMLADLLDAYYYEVVGEVHRRYAAFNDPKNFACRVVVYVEDKPIGCGCWKAVDERTAEMKRIYVLPEYRRKGVASTLIRSLEENAAESGCHRAVLETARTPPGSTVLYLSLGYRQIDYYGSPAGAENCICFEKKLVN